MANLNEVRLMGRLTRDVELKYTAKGTAVGKLGIAVNRTWKTESGEKMEEVTFVDVTCFGRQAETLAQYVGKGSGLHVSGRLKLDEWEDKSTGGKRSKLGVILEGFQFLGGKGDEQSAPQRTATSAAPSKVSDPDEDGVPF